MSLDYVKRLKELRRLDYVEKPMEVNEKSLVKKPKDKKEKDVEKNPIQSFQERAFLQIMLSNDRLKRGQDDTV